jgi:hypothetical protein
MSIKIGTARIDKSALLEAIGNQAGKYFITEAREAAVQDAQEAKDNTIEYFENHKVTKELQRDAYTQDSILPYGNLFSLLGFDEGTDPTEGLKEALEDNIEVVFEPTKYVNAKTGVFRYYFNILGPDKKDINAYTATAASVSRWIQGDSWVYQIEEGVSNIAQYLFDLNRVFSKSHSGPAIQVKADVHPGLEWSGTPYISQILDFLERQFR